MEENESNWTLNYFNYFTEIEEHFQRARGTGLFLLSPLDWALIESWKNAGIPLEAVLRGVDRAFESWRAGKGRTRLRRINSLAYCTQAVIEEAEALAGLEQGRPRKETAPPFSLDDVRAHLARGLAELRARGGDYETVSQALERVIEDIEAHYANLEELEQRLSALEEKMGSIARLHLSEEQLFEARRELDRQLRPYRTKMTADQLAMLERQYLERLLFERSGLPRLSLFYLR